MTTAAKPPFKQYILNGSTVIFGVPFRFNHPTHVQAVRIAVDGSTTVLAYGVDYSVTGGTTDDGGVLTLAAPGSAGERLQIRRQTPRDQSMNYTTTDTFPADSHEAAIDKAMLVDQEQDESIRDLDDRSLKVPVGETAPTLPGKDDRAGKFHGYDAEGNAVMLSGTGADAALRTDLVAGIGTLLLGWLQQGVGAVIRTLFAKLLDLAPSSADYGAVIDGVADDTVPLQRLFVRMATTGRADLLRGTYKVTQPLVIPPGALQGGHVVLDFRGANPADFPGLTPCVLIQAPAKTAMPNLSGDLAINTKTFNFAAPHGLAVGDTFQLCGIVPSAGNAARTYYTKGEMFKVARVVDADTVETEQPTRDTYPAAGVTCWKRSGGSFRNGCASLTILAPDAISYAVQLHRTDYADLGNLRCDGGYNGAIDVFDCFETRAASMTLRQQYNNGGGSYGLSFSNGQGMRCEQVRAHGYFNGVNSGGRAAAAGEIGMNRDIHLSGHFSSDPTGGLAGANFHGNTEYSSYRGVFSNGGVFAGNNNEMHGDFIGRSGMPVLVWGEMHGHSFRVSGTVRTTGVDLATNVGAIDMQDYGDHARYGGKTIFDIAMYAEQATRIMLWRTKNTTQTDVALELRRFDLMKAHPTTRVIALSKNSGNDMPLVEFGRWNIMDTAVGLTWSVNPGTKIRGLRARKTVAVTGTGVASATAAVSFSPAFPKTPTYQTSLQSAAFAAASPLVTSLQSATDSGGTVTIATTDKATQNINSTVVVEAALEDN